MRVGSVRTALPSARRTPIPNAEISAKRQEPSHQGVPAEGRRLVADVPLKSDGPAQAARQHQVEHGPPPETTPGLWQKP